MATGWVKSLQCKSRAVNDVVHTHHHHTNPKTHNSTSCRKSYQNIKDVVVQSQTTKPRKKSNPPSTNQSSSNQPTNHVRKRTSTSHQRVQDPLFPSLTELPENHPSRNVVEIIFHTSWSHKAFPGRVEMVFKVQSLNRTTTRFEEYRQLVKSRASIGDVEGRCDDHARCVADGNEMMRFYCLGPTNGGSFDVCGGAYGFHCGKGSGMCTFSSSGAAHENAGGGKGRRAVLVCRVIAGRVHKRVVCDSLDERVGFDSVSGDNDKLLVFDSRAVFPCFLIIYKL